MARSPELERSRGRLLHPTVLGLVYNALGALLLFGLLGFMLGRNYGHPQAGALIGLSLALLYGGHETWKFLRRPRRSKPDAPDDRI